MHAPLKNATTHLRHWLSSAELGLLVLAGCDANVSGPAESDFEIGSLESAASDFKIYRNQR